MTINNQNFEMYSGDSKIINVIVTNTDGSSLDLTGATIKWGVIKNSSRIIYKDTTSGIAINIPMTLGRFTITLNPSDTANISGIFAHEAEITDSVGDVSTVFTGVIKIITSQV
jgi:hypothetical protein